MVRTIAQIFRGYIWQPSSGCSQVTSGRTPSSFCSPPVPPLNTRGSNLPRLPRGPRCNMKRVQLPFRRGDVIADIHRIKTAWGVGGRGGVRLVRCQLLWRLPGTNPRGVAAAPSVLIAVAATAASTSMSTYEYPIAAAARPIHRTATSGFVVPAPFNKRGS